MVAFYDRVWEHATSTGAGTYIVSGALEGYRTFASVSLAPSDTFYYVATSGANWEQGLANFTAGTVSRISVQASSNGGGPVTFPGSLTIFMDLPASYIATGEQTTNKNQANGYAGLDGSAHVPSAQLPIGSAVQAWDADLDAIAAISATSGYLKKTAANTWALGTFPSVNLIDTVVADGVTDQSSVIQAAINALPSGGGTILLPRGTIAIASTLTISASNIALAAFGSDSRHTLSAKAGSQAGTILKWTGGANPMVRFTSINGASLDKLRGGGLQGILLDGRNLATRGLEILSWKEASFTDISLQYFTDAALYINVLSAPLGDNRNTQRNHFYGLYVNQIGATGKGVYLDSDNIGGANASFNEFYATFIQHADAPGIVLADADNNIFYETWVNHSTGSTGNAIEFWGNNTNAVNVARDNVFIHVSYQANVVAKGTTSFTYPALINCVEYIDHGNQCPMPVVEAGTDLHVSYTDGADYRSRIVQGGFGSTVAEAKAAMAALAGSPTTAAAIATDNEDHLRLMNSTGSNIWRLAVNNSTSDLSIAPITTHNAASLRLRSNSGWYIESGNHLKVATDNSYDIGAAGANRPRNIYAAGTVTGSNLSGTNTGDQTITLTGDVTGTGTGSFAATIANNAVTYAKFQQVAASSLVGNATGSLANATGITLGSTLAFSGSALQTAAMTGDVTTSANSFATTIANNAVSNAKFRQGAALSVVGVTGSSTANVADIAGTANQVLRVNGAGTALAFGAIDLSQSAAATGVLQAASFPALTGDVTTSAGALATTIASGAVSLSKMANLAANSIIGNNTGSPATPIALTATQVKSLLAISSSDVSGLGTAATVNTGTSGATIPLLNSANTWSGAQTHSAAITTAASASGGANFNIPNGTGPTSPNSGDIWTTTQSVEASINGSTFNLIPLFKALSADATGANSNTAQPWFPSAGGVTVEGSTTYRFKGKMSMNHGATTHTLALGFGGTATVTSILYWSKYTTGTDTGASTLYNATVTSANATVINATQTAANENVEVEGLIRINAGGSLIPQFTFSADPTGTITIRKNSFFLLEKMGANTVTTNGTWA